MKASEARALADSKKTNSKEVDRALSKIRMSASVGLTSCEFKTIDGKVLSQLDYSYIREHLGYQIFWHGAKSHYNISW